MKQLTFQLLIIVVLGFLTLPISHAQESNQAGLVIQYKKIGLKPTAFPSKKKHDVDMSY